MRGVKGVKKESKVTLARVTLVRKFVKKTRDIAIFRGELTILFRYIYFITVLKYNNKSV